MISLAFIRLIVVEFFWVDQSNIDPTGKYFCYMQSLYRSGGARKFAVQNLEPLGCLPVVRQEFKTGESCMEMVNFMVTTHNERLSRVLFAMTIPYRSLRYSLFDFNGEILRRINEPLRYGNIVERNKLFLTFGFGWFYL